MHDTALIRTPRLVLRPLGAGDAPALVAGLSHYDVTKWLSAVPFPYGPDDATAFLASPLAQPRRVWAICDEAGLRGVISIGDELGYWLARDAWGQGYGTEAADAVLDAAFADPTRREVTSSHLTANMRSGRVLERVGFRPMGHAERWFRALNQRAEIRLMRITRADWRARRRYRLRAGALRLTELRRGDHRALSRLHGLSPQAAEHWRLARLYRGRAGFAAAIRSWGRLIGTAEMYAGADGPADITVTLVPGHRDRATELRTLFFEDVRRRFAPGDIVSQNHMDHRSDPRNLA